MTLRHQGLFWDSSTSSLGIGTTVPARPLTVNGLAGFRNSTTGFGTNDGFDIGVGGSDAYIVQRENADIIIETNGAERLRIKGDGSSVFSGAVTSTGLTVDGNASVAGTTGVVVDTGTITTGKDSASSRTHWQMNNPNGQVAKWDSNGTDLLHYVTDEYKLYTGGYKAFEIDGNGDISFYNSAGTSQNLFWDSSTSRLGLGTTVPSHKLHIEATDDLALRLTRTGVRSFGQYINSTGNFVIRDLSGTPTDRLTINADGSSVFSGSVTANGLTVDGNTTFNTSSTLFANLNYSGSNLGKFSTDGVNLNVEATSNLFLKVNSATRAKFDGNGDISFYDGSGNQGLFWDSSTSRLGLGVTNPDTALHVETSADTIVKVEKTGGNYIQLHGTGAGGRIKSDGQINFDVGSNSGALNLASNGNATFSGSVSAPNVDITGALFDSAVNRGLKFDSTSVKPSNGSGGDANNHVDLGTTSTKFKNLYLSGTISSGAVTSTGLTVREDIAGSPTRIKISNDGTVQSGTSSRLSFYEGTSEKSYIERRRDGSGQTAFVTPADDNPFVFESSGSLGEFARFTGGNLLVGTTDTTLWNDNADNYGHNILGHGQYYSSTNGEINAYLNRQNSDGAILALAKDGSPVGSIRSISGDSIGIGNGDAGLRFVSGTNRIQPVDMDNGLNSDALTSLGDTNKRFKDLYLSSGVYLGGTGAANKLDDYEEGTWTPANAGNLVINSILNARYTKVGDIVTVTAWLKTNPSSTVFVISGLPFSSLGRSTASLSDVTNGITVPNQIVGNNIYGYAGSTSGTQNDFFISATYHV